MFQTFTPASKYLFAKKVTIFVRLTLVLSLSYNFIAPFVARAAPVPVITIRGPNEGFIGESQTFTLTFDNTGVISPTIGYGPYIDLYLPIDSNGETGEGLTFSSASYIGNSINATTYLCTGANIIHPLTGLSVACTLGQQLAVLELPFGSFTNNQPAASIDVNTNHSSPRPIITCVLAITHGTINNNLVLQPLHHPYSYGNNCELIKNRYFLMC